MSTDKVVRRRQPTGVRPRSFGPIKLATGDLPSLAFAWTATTPRLELVTGRISSVANAPAIQTAGLTAVQCSTGQRNIEWDNFGKPIFTSSGTGNGDFTVIVFARPTPTAAISHVFAQKNDAAGGTFDQICMLANSNASAGASSGDFAFFTYSGTGVGVVDTGGVDGRWHVWVGRRRGDAHEIWRDGVLRFSSTLGRITLTQASTRYMAVGSRGNGTTDAFGGQIAAVLAYNNALPDSELLGLTPDTFWRLWPRRSVPRPQTFTAPPPYTGPTLSAVTATDITATTARLRVTVTF